MKKYILTILALAGALASASAGVAVSKIDPPHWWVGMHNPVLQLQLYGEGIKKADISMKNYPGVTVDSVVRLDGSDNYLYLYLTVNKDAQPGQLQFQLKEGKKSKGFKYTLSARAPMLGAQGFDAGDVLYMLMPDRFADGDQTNNDGKGSLNFPIGSDRSDLNVRHGGDLAGIAQHLDYIDSLGVTAIWFNPVLENDMPGGSYHGYATTDYYKVDPRFGSHADYKNLIAELHSRGIQTVMDMIFNHSGSEHIWKKDPPATDWFNFQDGYVQTNYRLSAITDPYASQYDRKLATDGWFVEEMPDLNQRNPHLMTYLIQNGLWWIEEAQIDGIRMDTYPYADRNAMAKWIDRTLEEYPEFNIVGECWYAEPSGVMVWQKGSKLASEETDSHLPVVMDFPLMIKSRNLAPYKAHTDPWNGLNVVYDHFALDNIYPNPMQVLRFLDNHDTERMMLSEPESLEHWKQAQTILLTMPGIPQIYYGTELLMTGDRKPGDGNIRRDMPGGFPGDTVNAFSKHGRTPLQDEAYGFLTKILNWRKGTKAIAQGKMVHFMPTNGVYLYKRYTDDGDEAVIILNGQDNPLDVDMSRYAEAVVPGHEYRDILTDEDIIPIDPSIANKLHLSPRQILILEKK